MQKIELTQQKIEKLNKILNRHNSYKRFCDTQKDSYEYTATLGVRVCPYCNINFTYTVYERETSDVGNGEYLLPVCRPDLDHFEPKGTNPNKAMDAENLIPACQQCNSRVKFRTEFSRKTHLHPLFDDFDSLKQFSIRIRSPDLYGQNSFDIVFTDKGENTSDLERAQRTIDDLKLVFRYRYHKAEVIDLFEKARFYHRRKIDEIEDLVSTADLRRYLFSEVTAKINDVPLGKLKRDILRLILSD